MVSHPSGTYSQPIILEIASKDASYSFDGKSFVEYVGPFLIDRTVSLYVKTPVGVTRFDYVIEYEKPDKPGPIFIIGGADKSKSIHTALVEAAGREKTRIAFIPTGSANPYAAGMDRWVRFERYCGLTLDYSGIPQLNGKFNFADLNNNECFWIVPVAMLDDPNTNSRPTNDPDHVINDESTYPDINEATWVHGAEDVSIAKKLLEGNYTLLFLTGGNQSRYISAFYYPDGREKLLLQVIRYLHRKGAVIAGTSAGAASLSRWMLLSGGSAYSWLEEVREREVYEETFDPENTQIQTDGLILGKGLGFLPANVITDTHFSERGRQGRLLKALSHLSQKMPSVWGIGVDEDTAAIMYDSELHVVGTGGVFIATTTETNRYSAHYLTHQDKLILEPGEQFAIKNIVAGGVSLDVDNFPQYVVEPDIFGRYKFNQLIQHELSCTSTVAVFGLTLNDNDELSSDFYPPYREKVWLPLLTAKKQEHAQFSIKEIIVENFGKKDLQFPNIVQQVLKRVSYQHIEVIVDKIEIPFLPDFYTTAPELHAGRFKDVRATRIGLLLLPLSGGLSIQASFFDYAFDEENNFLILQTEPCEQATIIAGETMINCDENGFCIYPSKVIGKCLLRTKSGFQSWFELPEITHPILLFSKELT